MVAVHVLIDLHWQNALGGHVKSWQQFAKVAQCLSSEEIDLTLHFQGDRHAEIPQSSNVRYVLHKPRFSTKRLPFLQDVPSHTDLATHAPTLIPYLEQSDIVHTTHPLFTFGTTAQKFCTRHGKTLVSSIHTNAPLYAKIYLEEKLQKILGQNFLSHFFLNTLHLPTQYKASLDRKQTAYWQQCQYVWFNQPSEKQQLEQLSGVAHSRLRRGLDWEMFSPALCDRPLLQQQYGVPTESFLLLFVGRLDACKNLMTFAQAVKCLVGRQIPVHGVAVGKGSQADAIKTLLGKDISLLGALDQEKLGLIYASADLFVFPSETETVGNVVLEAKASGLVPCVSDQGGVTQLIQSSGQDGLIISGQDPVDWANEIQSLYEDPQKRSEMSAAAYRHVQESWPTWETVFMEDLLPVWRAIAN